MRSDLINNQPFRSRNSLLRLTTLHDFQHLLIEASLSEEKEER